jgi:hypothetical protein
MRERIAQTMAAWNDKRKGKPSGAGAVFYREGNKGGGSGSRCDNAIYATIAYCFSTNCLK